MGCKPRRLLMLFRLGFKGNVRGKRRRAEDFDGSCAFRCRLQPGDVRRPGFGELMSGGGIARRAEPCLGGLIPGGEKDEGSQKVGGHEECVGSPARD